MQSLRLRQLSMTLSSLCLLFGLCAYSPRSSAAGCDDGTGPVPDFSARASIGPVSINGFSIVNAEYLPFTGTNRLHYPDDVLWGFDAPGASSAGKACGSAAYSELVVWLENNDEVLQALARLGSSSGVYLWINDYSQSASRPSYRSPRLWHTNVGADDLHAGYWNYEATLLPSGTCLLPNAAEVLATFQAAVAELSRDAN